MKTQLNFILISATSVIIFFAGCATTTETSNTKSLLSQAGFRARTPQTAQQKELYAALPSNKIDHGTAKGKSFYVFKDEKAGVAYIGGEPEHRRYLQLSIQQHAAQAPEEEMSHPFAQNWQKRWGGGATPFG